VLASSTFKKTLNFIFFPAILLTILLSCSSTLIHLSQKLLINIQLDTAHIPLLKVSQIPFSIIFVLTLFMISKYLPFEKIFKRSLISLIGIASFFAGIVLFQKHIPLSSLTEALTSLLPPSMSLYKPLVMNWPTSLLYITLSLLNVNLFSLLIWGFINRLSSIKEGIKYYLPLAFVLGTIGALISQIDVINKADHWSLMATLIPAIAFVILALITFNWAWKRLPNDRLLLTESPSHRKFPFLNAAYLLAGCIMIKYFVDFLFKIQLRTQISDAASYSKFIQPYPMTIGTTTMIISILCTVLGTWVLLKKNWRNTILFGSVFALTAGLIFLSSSAFSLSSIKQGIFVGILASLSSALFFPLIQMLYLHIPPEKRFKTMIAVQMLILPVIKSAPSLTAQGLTVILGSVSLLTTYLQALIPILLLLLVVASVKSSKFLDQSETTNRLGNTA